MEKLIIKSITFIAGLKARQLGIATLMALGMVSASAQTPRLTEAKKSEVPALAAKSAVTVQLSQSRVVKGADGKEQLLDAKSVKPGDVIEYRVTYTNRSDKAVSGVVATLPIPVGLEYQSQSARPNAIPVQAATSDQVYGAEPLIHKIGGKTEPVPYADYRTLRWTIGQLAAHGQAIVSARAVVPVFAPTGASVAGAHAMPLAPPAIANARP
ncbi:hypothetical protein RGU70_14405 [Herbaspirillum sp. RTI4]|uniref:hypothetical protein n=1 Tax=Herbaspirillum sp. RTI4 TaxID=3048640 RepID=UPI002AB3639B|nr:hypothetical protein [Herbaspirillum sp. RTI4]MDY7579507.1 hypothetical protein [Herbaspirillum sp. RTI4]MEA9980421.1 hypothetical protein [Herbaspirillum sp. RTI4]